MKREDVENAANVFYEASKLRSTTWETELIAFAIRQVNAALEEAARETVKNCLDGSKNKPCVFCREQSAEIRALKIGAGK